MGNLGIPYIQKREVGESYNVYPDRGAVFYNRSSNQILQLTEKAINNILKIK